MVFTLCFGKEGLWPIFLNYEFKCVYSWALQIVAGPWDLLY